jgi:arylsulfatase A-like enzyme
VDVAPTILDLAGISPLTGTPPFQGRSLKGRLMAPNLTPGPFPLREGESAVGLGAPIAASLAAAPSEHVAGGSEVFAEATPGDKPNPQVHARVVVDHRWKYVYRPDDDVTEEHYDLQTDPGSCATWPATQRTYLA